MGWNGVEHGEGEVDTKISESRTDCSGRLIEKQGLTADGRG